MPWATASACKADSFTRRAVASACWPDTRTSLSSASPHASNAATPSACTRAPDDACSSHRAANPAASASVPRASLMACVSAALSRASASAVSLPCSAAFWSASIRFAIAPSVLRISRMTSSYAPGCEDTAAVGDCPVPAPGLPSAPSGRPSSRSRPSKSSSADSRPPRFSSPGTMIASPAEGPIVRSSYCRAYRRR